MGTVIDCSGGKECLKSNLRAAWANRAPVPADAGSAPAPATTTTLRVYKQQPPLMELFPSAAAVLHRSVRCSRSDYCLF